MAEKRLIDANALMDAFRSHMVEKYDRNKCTLEENCKTCEPGCLWRKKVSEAHTVEAVEVVHGRWMKTKEPLGWQEVDVVECSICHESWLGDEDDSFDYLEHWHYCPNCGAKMDGERKDNDNK